MIRMFVLFVLFGGPTKIIWSGLLFVVSKLINLANDNVLLISFYVTS